VKNCDLGLENAAVSGSIFKTSIGHSFSLYGPPSRQITYIYIFQYSIAKWNLTFPALEDVVNFMVSVEKKFVHHLIMEKWPKRFKRYLTYGF